MFGRRLAQTALVGSCLAMLLAGCGGMTGVDDTGVVTPPPPKVDPTEPANRDAASLSKVSGDSQSTLVNQIVAQRLVVKVTDANGDPVKNAEVKWTLGGTGTVVPVSPATDENGEASATWQLGADPGAQFVRAEVGNFNTTFTGTATLQFSSVDAGGFHACAITPSAAVYCWGYNGDGQLGIGAYDNRNVPTALSPVQDAEAKLTFRQLSGGRYHTCGITLSGVAYCWGANLDGRLGTDDQTPSARPRQAATAVAFASIGSGWNHTCGLSKAGLVYCWGFNQEGEVGARIPPADSVRVLTPRPVSAQSFKEMAVGGLHSCAIDLTDKAWCWGFNGYGQLGDGTTNWTLNNLVDSTGAPIAGIPVAVQTGLNFQSIAAGAQHTCALAAGIPWCWGDNRYWQLGTSGVTRSLTPLQVSLPAGVTGFASLSAGDYHTCGVTAAGKAYCWGDNEYGQLGTGTTANSPTPIPVAPELTFTSFSAGETLSCGVTTEQTVYCVGNNLYGQVGDATNEARTSPVKVAYQP
jgi:alpha-tubulin suppressor-like RCC1 family protein